MTLLLSPAALGARREAAHGPLAPLLHSLRSDLALVIAASPEVPREKARLTRAGGTCSRDGTRLAFDPWSPREHRCPRCGGVERDDVHYRMWLMWYQMWLAERALQGALIHRLAGGAGELALATGLLEQYADHYLAFPNRDNVLGPSRVFFSTYLESIWLLQLCIATDLLGDAGIAAPLCDRVRERVIEPAARMIAEFDEGQSNRQVWNNAALLAAGRVLGDGALVDGAVGGRSGIVSHLASGLLEDGSWYEGENYHVFAHRGLWYALTMAQAAGIELPAGLVRRFDEGFVTPWLTALPDMTMPSRRDSPHAVSLRQWRFAEMAELGLARSADPRLLDALGALYGGAVPPGDTGRSRSAADIERNEPATALTRADLGWRALLHARPSLGDLPGRMAPRSAVLEGQGFAVLRRDAGQVYAALDYGHSGGGHGHPDRLGILLCDGETRWLDDPGTGSYVDPSLHWYRSTLAHNAPLVDGRSQARTHGRLAAFDERGDVGWVSAVVEEIAPGVSARRSLVVMPDYLVDVVQWRSHRPVRFEVPVHTDGETEHVRWQPMTLEGGTGLEDGFTFVKDSQRAVAAPGAFIPADGEDPLHGALIVRAIQGARSATVHLLASPSAEWWRAGAPGAPGTGERRFHLARQAGTSGRLTMIWDLRDRVRSCAAGPDGEVRVERSDGHVDEHEPAGDGWRVTTRRRDARVVDLGGAVPGEAPSPPGAHPARRQGSPPHIIRTAPLIFELGAPHYRRSELSWAEAGEPRALVAISRDRSNLIVGVRVFTDEMNPVPAGAVNEMDNEHPDVNGDGIQLHVRIPPASPAHGGAAAGAPMSAGWMAVPEPDDRLRIREITGSGAGWVPEGGWQPMPDGYRALLHLPLARLGTAASHPIALDVLVNETAAGRERRRGQLVLSGARGEWVYLRGDRQPPDRFLTFLVDDA